MKRTGGYQWPNNQISPILIPLPASRASESGAGKYQCLKQDNVVQGEVLVHFLIQAKKGLDFHKAGKDDG